MIEKINLEKFPLEIRDKLIPDYMGDVVYECIGCGKEFDINQFLYICPKCRSLLRLNDRNFNSLKRIKGKTWRERFYYRKKLNLEPFKRIFFF